MPSRIACSRWQLATACNCSAESAHAALHEVHCSQQSADNMIKGLSRAAAGEALTAQSRQLCRT